MMRRLVHVSAAAAAATTPHTGAAAAREFSSNYSRTTDYKPPTRYDSRSGAHRRPVRQNYPRNTETNTASAPTQQAEPSAARAVAETTGEADTTAVQRNVKNNYEDLFKPKRTPISFTSSFKAERGSTASSKTSVQRPQPVRQPAGSATSAARSGNRGSASTGAARDDDADVDDVTRIYSREEVDNMVHSEPKPSSRAHPRTAGIQRTNTSERHPGERDADVLRVLEGDDDDSADVVTRTYHAPEDDAEDGHVRASGAAEQEEGAAEAAETDKFAQVREHPFYAELIKRIDKTMTRYRREVRLTGRYSLDAINDCIRPLLQLTDYPFTTAELSQLASSISPAALKGSLPNRLACRRMHIYRSPDTDLVLDWSAEDFLRRRYESVHLSWEPLDVVRRRFGWTDKTMSDRDLLMYFSAFDDFVELAELEMSADGKPKALPISDPVAHAERAPIPASRLLIRRVPSEDAEPSVTESIRLMGTPALERASGKDSHRQRDTVSGMFAAVDRAAKTVDGDADAKLDHAMDSVRSLRQATHSAGRTVKEFSLGKRGGMATSAGRSSTQKDANEGQDDDERIGSRAGVARSDKKAKYDLEAYEQLSSAFHKTKVEIAVLHRRLLSTTNASEAEEIKQKVARQRRELDVLKVQLRHLSQLRHQQQVDLEEGNAVEEDDDDDDNGGGLAAQFTAPRGRPAYTEAPERDPRSANMQDNDEDDIDISQELMDYEAERNPKATRKASAKGMKQEEDTAAAAEEDEQVTEEVLEAEDENDDLEAEDVDRRKPAAHQYMQAPERRSNGLRQAAAEEDDDDDIDISAELHEYDEERNPNAMPKVAVSKMRQQEDVAAVEEDDEQAAEDVLEADDAQDDVEAEDENDDLEVEDVDRRKPAAHQYMQAPERRSNGLKQAAAEEDDDDDIDISAELQEYDEGRGGFETPMNASTSAAPSRSATTQRLQPYSAAHRTATARAQHRADTEYHREQPTAAVTETGADDEVADEVYETPARNGRDRRSARADNDDEEELSGSREAEQGDDINEAEADEEALAAGDAEEDASATSDAEPAKRSEALAQAVEKLSSATNKAKKDLASVREEKEAMEKTINGRIAACAKRVRELEDKLEAAIHEHRGAVEAEAREATEARARAVEKELEVQRARRMSELAEQREMAKKAQLAAQKALERQQKVEQEALAMERELEMKLAKVRAQLRATEDATHEAEHEGTAALAEAPEEDTAPTKATMTAQEEPLVRSTAGAPTPTARQGSSPAPAGGAAAPSGPVFMCTPEQYDGLHLAAARLRTEISALEKQMEEEGDEDDETLMLVLAASRTDLEELDDCIRSVQQNASWAAARDAMRDGEKEKSATAGDSEVQRVQARVDTFRFQIELLEKRLHHATERNVITKLEQKIVSCRREIARLRREQDRLRRDGRGTLGFPASISIAETLANEGRASDARRKDAENAIRYVDHEAPVAAAGDAEPTDDLAAQEHEVVDEDESAADAGNNSHLREDASAEETLLNDSVAGIENARTVASKDTEDTAAETHQHQALAGASSADPEAERLRERLDSMLGDIQHLQDNIAAQERTSDYDDEETEAVLLEMKNKLGQLLHLRNAVQERLASNASTAGAPSPTPVASPSLSDEAKATAPVAEPPRMPSAHQRALGGKGYSSQAASAAKKVRRAARNSRK